MKALSTLKIAALAGALVSPLHGQITLSFSTPYFEIGVLSDGVTPLPDDFLFEIGTFNSFVPTLGNMEQWASNFVSLPTNTLTPPLSWTDEGDGTGEVADTFTLNKPSDNAVVGDTAFVWGFNSKSFVSGSEWILIDTGKVFPAIPDDETIGADWILSTDEGASAVLGFLGAGPWDGNDPIEQPVFLQTAAVPEPSTYAALMGLVTLGLVGYRRFRRR